MRKSIALVPVLALAAAGCAGRSGWMPPPDADAPRLGGAVTRVAVLPPFVETLDPEAWKVMWPPLVEAVASRGYAVVDVKTIDDFYGKNRFFIDPAEIKLYTATELAKEFGADAVLYSNITRWGFTYLVAYSEFGVDAEFELVDGKTGDVLWKNKGSAVQRAAIGGRNLIELAFTAVGVLGNAFLGSTEGATRRCIAGTLSQMPVPGPASPGTIPAPAPSQPKAPNEASPKAEAPPDPKPAEEQP